ncbi:putative mitochondrial import inner membrane translocase subunit TIM21 isoform X1 [Silene latifolia]|uniref:putative mitochondrial import inner membrane translocase subunit TIM21 isoform X1 n=1 Tax=Silene latifolia TaxID=37657 RepID=UPI003D779A99
MASRATRSILSRRNAHPLSISSFKRLISSSPPLSSAPPIASYVLMISEQLKKRLLDVSTRRYYGSGCGVVEETINKTYSLASVNSRFTHQLREKCRTYPHYSFYRSFASRSSSDRPGQKQTNDQKDISTVEDPFDSPTYHIPEKPVTYAEGGFYSVVIIAGLGVAAIAAYAVVKELLLEPKEYKIFNKALDRIQNDSQVRVRIGSPIKGYGQESRNRSARQRIPNRTWTDVDGVEHIQINFCIRGPHGNGNVFCEMFKDKVDKEWKYMALVVEIANPTQKQLILESYLPA